MKIADPLPIVKTINKQAVTDPKSASILQSSKDMESVFLAMVMKSMQKTLGEGALGSSQNNLASMLFSNVLGEAISEGGGIGLADKITEGLSQQEEIQMDLPEPGINPLLYQQISYDNK